MQSQALHLPDEPYTPSRRTKMRHAIRDWQPCYRFAKRHLRMPDRDRFKTASGNTEALAWMDATIAWDEAHPLRYRLWRIYCVGTHPVDLFKDHTTRPLRRFWQRGRRGWCYEDAWSVDGYLSRIIPELLDELRKNNHGWPGEPMTFEEWNGDGGILDQIAQAFRSNAKACNMDYVEDGEHYDHEKHAPMEVALMKQSKAGLKLFVKYYNHLWD